MMPRSLLPALPHPSAFGLLALVVGAPVSAGGLTDLHPAEACILKEADAQLSARMVDELLAAVGLAHKPEAVTEDDANAIGFECIKIHGIPERNARLFGNYTAGVSLRDEARRRLEARGYDLSRVDSILATTVVKASDNADAVATDLVERIDREGHDGQAIAPEEAKLITALVYTYAYGHAALEVAAAKLGG